MTIEGPRARTVVDHIFRNPHGRPLEGTFEYPLPTGASPSYFAMFLGQSRDTPPPRFARRGKGRPLPETALARLAPAALVREVPGSDWGNLQEGRIVAHDRALEAYEDTVRGRIDPALLEYAGGNTFRGRVFPIPANGYNRVIIAYEELLPASADGVRYRFPLPDCRLTDLHFTLQAPADEVREPDFRPRGARPEEADGRQVFRRTWAGRGPGGEVVFTFRPATPRAQVISGRQDGSGPLYLYARLRPDLPARAARPFSPYAVFLLDTSLSENPDRFAVNMKLLRRILETDPDIKHFNVLTLDVAARWLEPRGWLDNTPAGREQAWSRLDGLLLEGATDLGAALDKLARPGLDLAPGTPLHVFLLSDGQVTWGESNPAALAARLEKNCPYPVRVYCYPLGLGAENQELFEALTRRGGGIFPCHGEGDLAAAAAAHRRQCLQVERVRFEGLRVRELLIAGRRTAVYPGGDLLLAGRADEPGRGRVVLEGTFEGRKVTQSFPVEVAGTSELAPRAWGEVAVASLLALNDPGLDPLITAYCQEFNIASRVASFLVLENQADYKRLNLQEERGRILPDGDLGRFLEEAWQRLARALPAREVWVRLLTRGSSRNLVGMGGMNQPVGELLGLLGDADFDLPDVPPEGPLVYRSQVPLTYLADRERDPRALEPPLAESSRRALRRDRAGAVRALSSVVEEYPGRTDALRLVGYRLLDLKQPFQAARLFRRVLEQRPFEAHSYRDLAHSLEEGGKFGLAALNYEIVLAGAWHNRFGAALQTVAAEEYVHMLKRALGTKGLPDPLARQFARRLEQLAGRLAPADLRVTISWNTDGTDVDLWVIEPDGTKCFYGHPQTDGGGELSQDQTQGYGPERYQIRKARPGVYRVLVHYFSQNRNLLGGETHVQVVITRHAGTRLEVTERRTVVLRRQDQHVLVAEVKF